MILQFNTWKLQNKILVICLVLANVPAAIISLINYGLMENTLYEQINDKLTLQVQQYKNQLTANLENVQQEELFQKENAKNIITQQTRMLIQLLKFTKKEDNEKLADIISRFQIGKTGYVYILDYRGRYILSSNHQRDGEDISGSKDETGRLYIRDIINKGLAMESEEAIDYDTYLWKNTGEAKAREKIAAIIHAPSRAWIIGVTAYYDDLVDVDIEEKKINDFKNKLLKEKVGDDGYMFVMNSKGDLIMHPKQEGENIYQNDFIKTMCRDKMGYIQYLWEGKPKIVAYDYYQPKDWIIASGSYLKDFTRPLIAIQISIMIVLGVSLLSVIFISLLFARGISKSLDTAITGLSENSRQLTSASNQLSSSSQDIANGATEQAASIEETSASMEELSSMVKQNSRNAKEASILADKASDASQSGYGQMEKMLDSMNGINKSSDQIKKIIKVIDDIAFQTNILALNAAVEAARAGEAGMGFAVVADEVKNLANRSAAAAKETSGMIEESINKINGGLGIAAKLADAFKEILVNAKKVSEMFKEVEAASRQQDSGINQVNKAIIQFDEIVQSNASAAEETASSSEELQSQAESLYNIINDLMVMIKGRKAKDANKTRREQPLEKTGRNEPVKKVIKTNKEQETVPTEKQLSQLKRKKEISPEKIIPFEEDEEFTVIE